MLLPDKKAIVDETHPDEEQLTKDTSNQVQSTMDVKENMQPKRESSNEFKGSQLVSVNDARVR